MGTGETQPARTATDSGGSDSHVGAYGCYPQVKLLFAERRECGKALALTRAIDREYAEADRERRARPRFIPGARPGDPARTCYAHLDNIRRHLTIEDYSRVDAMIALRMRATGHSREAVAEAIRNCAPTIRKNPKGRDWQRYAERTVDYAFGNGHRNHHIYRLYMHMMQAIYTKIRYIPCVKTYQQCA